MVKGRPTDTVVGRGTEIAVEVLPHDGSVQRKMTPRTFRTPAGSVEPPSRNASIAPKWSPVWSPGADCVPSLNFAMRSRAGRARVAAPGLAAQAVMPRLSTRNVASIPVTVVGSVTFRNWPEKKLPVFDSVDPSRRNRISSILTPGVTSTTSRLTSCPPKISPPCHRREWITPSCQSSYTARPSRLAAGVPGNKNAPHTTTSPTSARMRRPILRSPFGRGAAITRAFMGSPASCSSALSRPASSCEGSGCSHTW